ncbi:integrase, partial [Enterococcus faecium]
DSSEKMDYQKKWTSTKSIKDSSHPLRPKETISLENH